jgi:hypothetical protein
VAEAKSQGLAGETAYPTKISIDHGEHPGATGLVMEIGQSDYAEVIAAKRLGDRDGEVRTLYSESLATDGGLSVFLAQAHPSALSANVLPVSSDGMVLALRRSASVESFALQWGLGINESMTFVDVPGAQEDIVALVHRAMREELGLLPHEYSQPTFTGLNFSLPAMHFGIHATVRLRVSRQHVDEQRLRAHSVFEHDRSAWVPTNAASLGRIVVGGPDPEGGSAWVYFAKASARELLRYPPPVEES